MKQIGLRCQTANWQKNKQNDSYTYLLFVKFPYFIDNYV